MPTPTPDPERGAPWGRPHAAATAAVLAVATALRILSARGSLWLDEITSLTAAARLGSPWEVLYRIHSDNNHYLNSAWMSAAGFRGDWSGYRAPSVLAGIGAVALAGMIGRAWGRAGPLFAMALTGFSYVLVLYSSEARGYASLVFFSFLSFLLLDRHLRGQGAGAALGFAASSCLGLLSHLTFAMFLGSALGWAVLGLRGRPPGRVAASLGLSFGAPAALASALYLADVRAMAVDGGDNLGIVFGYRSALAWALGVPAASWTGALSLAALALLAAGLWRLGRRRPDLLAPFAGTIVVVPLALVLATHPTVIYVRYFILPVAFLQLLMALLLTEAFDSGKGGGAALAAAATAAFVALNAPSTAVLLKEGRGRSADAVRLIAGDARAGPATVGGSQDFRVGSVIAFEAASLGVAGRVAYCPAERLPPGGPEWFVYAKDYYSDPGPVRDVLYGPTGGRYSLVATFPCPPLSGLPWFVYRRG
jgi:hypothetical protein